MRKRAGLHGEAGVQPPRGGHKGVSGRSGASGFGEFCAEGDDETEKPGKVLDGKRSGESLAKLPEQVELNPLTLRFANRAVEAAYVTEAHKKLLKVRLSSLRIEWCVPASSRLLFLPKGVQLRRSLQSMLHTVLCDDIMLYFDIVADIAVRHCSHGLAFLFLCTCAASHHEVESQLCRFSGIGMALQAWPFILLAHLGCMRGPRVTDGPRPPSAPGSNPWYGMNKTPPSFSVELACFRGVRGIDTWFVGCVLQTDRMLFLLKILLVGMFTLTHADWLQGLTFTYRLFFLNGGCVPLFVGWKMLRGPPGW
jgi:hypothetical protein